MTKIDSIISFTISEFDNLHIKGSREINAERKCSSKPKGIKESLIGPNFSLSRKEPKPYQNRLQGDVSCFFNPFLRNRHLQNGILSHTSPLSLQIRENFLRKFSRLSTEEEKFKTLSALIESSCGLALHALDSCPQQERQTLKESLLKELWKTENFYALRTLFSILSAHEAVSFLHDAVDWRIPEQLALAGSLLSRLQQNQKTLFRKILKGRSIQKPLSQDKLIIWKLLDKFFLESPPRYFLLGNENIFKKGVLIALTALRKEGFLTPHDTKRIWESLEKQSEKERGTHPFFYPIFEAILCLHRPLLMQIPMPLTSSETLAHISEDFKQKKSPSQKEEALLRFFESPYVLIEYVFKKAPREQHKFRELLLKNLFKNGNFYGLGILLPLLCAEEALALVSQLKCFDLEELRLACLTVKCLSQEERKRFFELSDKRNSLETTPKRDLFLNEILAGLIALESESDPFRPLNQRKFENLFFEAFVHLHASELLTVQDETDIFQFLVKYFYEGDIAKIRNSFLLKSLFFDPKFFLEEHKEDKALETLPFYGAAEFCLQVLDFAEKAPFESEAHWLHLPILKELKQCFFKNQNALVQIISESKSEPFQLDSDRYIRILKKFPLLGCELFQTIKDPRLKRDFLSRRLKEEESLTVLLQKLEVKEHISLYRELIVDRLPELKLGEAYKSFYSNFFASLTEDKVFSLLKMYLLESDWESAVTVLLGLSMSKSKEYARARIYSVIKKFRAKTDSIFFLFQLLTSKKLLSQGRTLQWSKTYGIFGSNKDKSSLEDPYANRRFFYTPMLQMQLFVFDALLRHDLKLAHMIFGRSIGDSKGTLIENARRVLLGCILQEFFAEDEQNKGLFLQPITKFYSKIKSYIEKDFLLSELERLDQKTFCLVLSNNEALLAKDFFREKDTDLVTILLKEKSQGIHPRTERNLFKTKKDWGGAFLHLDGSYVQLLQCILYNSSSDDKLKTLSLATLLWKEEGEETPLLQRKIAQNYFWAQAPDKQYVFLKKFLDVINNKSPRIIELRKTLSSAMSSLNKQNMDRDSILRKLKAKDSASDSNLGLVYILEQLDEAYEYALQNLLRRLLLSAGGSSIENESQKKALCVLLTEKSRNQFDTKVRAADFWRFISYLISRRRDGASVLHEFKERIQLRCVRIARALLKEELKLPQDHSLISREQMPLRPTRAWQRGYFL